METVSPLLALFAGNSPVTSKFPTQTPVTRILDVFLLIEAEWRIYASLNWVFIGSDNGLSPVPRQPIIWTNAGVLLIGRLRRNFREIWIGIQTFSFKKLHLKTTSAKWRLFCLGLNELISAWINGWVNRCETGYLRRHRAYYDATHNELL